MMPSPLSSRRATSSATPHESAPHDLTLAQQAVWLDQISHPRAPLYNIGMTFEIEGPVDLTLLEHAMNEVANANDALRLVLREGGADDMARQIVLPQVDTRITFTDLSGQDDADSRARAWLAERFAQPFTDLGELLWDTHLVRSGPDHYYWMHRYHHLVADGLGIAVIGHGVAQAYARLLKDPNATVEPGPSYLGQVDEDRAYMSSPRYEKDRRFWHQRFATVPPSLLPRAGVLGDASPSEQLRWSLDRGLFNRLAAFAGEHGASITHIFLAVLGVCFSRLNQLEEVVVGLPVHNRGTAQLKRTVGGMFSSVSPIGIRVAPDATLVDLIGAISAELRLSYRHQRFPIAELNRNLNLAQHGRQQLFDVRLSIETLKGDHTFGNTIARVQVMDNGYEQTPLSIFVRDYHPNADVTIDFNFNDNGFRRDELERIRQCIELLLTRAIELAETPVSRLPLMDDVERRRLLVELNDTAVAYPRDRLVHQLFEDQVARRRRAVALEFAGEEIGYDQLNRRANQLAHRLIALGVKPDDRIAICLERSVEMVVGLLAIMKAGAAYVPIDPSYPADRLTYLLEDSAPVALLTQVRLARALPASAVPTLALDDPATAASFDRESEDNPDAATLGLTPRHLAYVIYTSGSTGHPKGAMNEHLGVVNRLLWAQDEYRLGPDDRVLQKTPFGFDVSVWEFFLPLLAGARLVIARPDGHRDPRYLADLIDQRGITMLHFVPSMLQVFLDELEPQRCTTLRHLLCSGEALPYTLQRRCHALLPQARLSNLYGPTEAAIDVTFWRCDSDAHPGIVPIGRPVANTQVYLLDEHGQPVPMGAIGELHLGGVQVARGYLNRPELTAERFVHDPFSGAAGARLYKTGDLGRYLADGSIEYLGRNDFQVKIRGLRVELGEIETRLAACEGVREAVAIARDDGHDGTRLVAYLVPLESACLVPADLRAALAAALPDYMVPNAFVVMDAFPLSPNGKLDRRALPAPDADAQHTRSYQAPQGETEQAIAAIWQQLLGVERVGRLDGFFDLGGHSLRAVQLGSRLRKQFGAGLPLRELFARPVLADLAALIDAGGVPMAELPLIDVQSRSQRLPLSFAQQRLWFLDTLDEAAGAAYHMAAALRLTGPLDKRALRAALDRIVARHEVLRTTFATENGQPYQHIADAAQGFALAEHDLCHVPVDEQHAAVARLREAEAVAPFDLATGPLIRGQLLTLADDHHVLLVTQHHIVSDGWSVGVLVDEISTLYDAFHHQLADPLPPLAIQYADYAAWQRASLSGETLSRQAGFWTDHLQGAPALLELPTDRPRPAVQRYAGGRVAVTFPRELGEALRKLGQQQGTTLFMTLFAGWAALLSRLTHQHDVVIGTPVANRPRTELEPLIGFFVNTLALRVRTDDDPDVAALLQQVKTTALAAYAHQDLPFEQVVEALQPPRSLSHSPIFQVMLSLNNTPAHSLALSSLQLETIAQSHVTTQFDLSLSLVEEDGLISGDLEYASDLFDAATPERLVANLQTLLAAMAAEPGRRVSALPLLDAPQRQQLLVDFNATAARYPTHQTVHALFETVVARQPDAIAVSHGDASLSYDALNRRANRVAHALLELGVQPDQRVAICTERGLDTIAGLLGILKAGAAYVPLDPAYPAARIKHMLADSSPVAVLTQRALAASLPATDAPTLLLDDHDAFERWSAHNPSTHVSSSNLVYLIYTSGSTGTPKGVMVEHRNLVNYTTDAVRLFGISPADVVFQQNSLNFDLSAEEIFPALLGGATLMPATQLFGAGSFASTRPSVVHLTAAHWHTLVAEWDRVPQRARELLDSVRLVNVTGDALSTQKLELWDRFRPAHTRLVNTYGPTETTVSCTAAYVSYDQAHARGMSIAPIGTPLANTRIHLLDAHLELVPLGATGEIHIGGDGVARGYLNRDALTAERFIRDPFSSQPGARLYRTGDLARWLPDGSLEYLGRNDSQVKIRGFRIELGEVEARLADCDGVSEAAVVARKEQDGSRYLVAYIVPQDGAELGVKRTEKRAVTRLRNRLASTLADYMVPHAFVVLRALPLTPNGKLDRNALPEPDESANLTRAFEAPRGSTETALAHIWQELLGVEQVGRNDSFFEVGGHSLLAIKLIERLRQKGLKIDVRTVFAAPVLSGMADAIGAVAPRAVPAVAPNGIPEGCTAITPVMLPLVELSQAEIDLIAAAVPGGTANLQDIYPLSSLQDGILFHHLLDTEGDAYLMRTVLAFDSRRRLDDFLAAMQTVISRHDVLRSSVHWNGLRQPVQVVHRHAALVVESPTLDAGRDTLEQLLALTDTTRVRIDLASAPLCRAWIATDPRNDEWLLSLLDHHMVSDHVTLELMLEEIRTIMGGRGEQLRASMPYRNFIAQLRAVEPGVHERYFRQQLGDIETPTALFGRFDTQGDGADIHEASLALSADLAQRIRDCAQRQGVTGAVLFHAAWAQVLSACTGQDDVVFGTVLSGRLQGTEGADQAFGMFLNTLPVRGTPGGRSVAELTDQLRANLSGLLEHEQASLATAQRCSAVPASLPLFSTLLNYRHSPETARTQHGTAAVFLGEGVRVLAADERTNYPFDMTVDDLGQGLALTLRCVTAVDPKPLLRYLASAVEAIVEALTEEPSRPASHLAVLPADEQRRLVAAARTAGSETAAPSAAAATEPVHRRFEAQAAAQPDALALSDGETRLSYGELERRANALAHRLIGAGVVPDARVAIHLERSVDMVVGLLAILKAGAAYVPVDPSYPAERVAYMIADCAPAAILTRAHARSNAQAATLRDSKLPWFDPRDVAAAGDDPAVPAVELAPSNLAYVIYTSGSTGEPKGVMVEHGGLSNLMDWYLGDVGVGRDDAVLIVTSPSFDLTQKNLLAPLMTGGTLHLAEPRFDPPAILARIRRDAIGHLNLSPSAFHALIDADTGHDLSRLRRVVLGGEPIQAAKLAAIAAPRPVFINSYGPTECSDVAGWHRLSADLDAYRDTPVPLGRPIRHAALYLLDRHGRLVPPGVVGEICIGGAGIARGYLNRPELTAERFARDPFSDVAGARLYRTGDLGRHLADGGIEYLGRDDFQVKIRGVRVELGEIETALAACDGVQEAVVTARHDGGGDDATTRLVAYVVPHAGVPVTPAGLRTQLAAQLPDYMVPNAFVALDAFPLTPNGKLDRRALPASEASAVVMQAYAAPQGETERAIAAIWQDLLGLERVGRHDSFLELGGHSLLALQLASRLRKVLDAEVTLRELLDRPMLADLAALIETGTASAAALPPITPRPRSGRLPLSFAQQRLWFLDALNQAAGAAYHIPAALRLTGKLDQDALRAALERIVARHEVLRTTIAAERGEPFLRIADATHRFALTRRDLREIAAGEREQAVARIGEAEAIEPFDLGHGPLVRGQLLELADEDHILLVTQHHIVSDGWSIGVLIDELSALYDALHRGLPDPLPPLAIQYADYAAWQRDRLQGETLKRQTAFWKARLKDAPALLELPTDRPRPAVQSYLGASVPVALPRELGDALRELGRQQGATLFMTLFAGWAALLSRIAQQHDLVIGTPVANRTQAELESLIGFFVNTLALRVRLEDDPDVRTLLQRVKADALAAYAHQELPFEQVVEAVQPPRSLAHSPIFQTMISLDNTPSRSLELPGLQLAPLAPPSLSTQFDLSLSLVDKDGLISGELEYASDLFDAATIERLVANLQTLLAGMAADTDCRVGALPLLDEAQRRQVLVDFNATAGDYPANSAANNATDLAVHMLFERQARATPHAIGVVHGEGTLSYDALNRQANRIAHALIELGVGADQRVAICVERGLDMVAGLLGILKAGAAYVPLDPAYPAARLEHMLADSTPVAVLTQQALAGKLPPIDAPTLLVDAPAALARHPEHDPDVPVAPTDLAYVIYTSGSTGLPKGVMIEHRGVCNQIAALRQRYALIEQDRILQFASIAFDMSVEEIFGALLVGATLVLRDDSWIDGTGAFIKRCTENGITVANLPTSFWQQLAQDHAQTLPASLRQVMIGGEAVTTRALAAWFARPGHLPRLFNAYGPTETTVNASIHEPTRDAHSNLSIGAPVANTRLYILDTNRQPVPVGVSGELYIGGAGVARGYLNRAELTAERFLDDPFSATRGARMYRTGDLVRWFADGSVEYLGRNDHQVKIRGFRIELGEIEACLARHAQVREAVVVARDSGAGDKLLVAYCTMVNASPPTTAEALRAHVQANLPEYMVPSAYVQLDALPLTPNRKLDRNALPAPQADAYVRRGYEAPQGEVEEQLTHIWQTLLGVEQIGRHDDFFELGGHSLLAVRLISRVREATGIELGLAELFAHPRLAALAHGMSRAASSTLPPIASVDRHGALPLSFAQQRLWFLAQMEGVGTAYHMPAALRLTGTLDRDALQAALDRIVARHEALRTTFSRQGAQVVQRIGSPDAGLPIVYDDLAAAGAAHEFDTRLEQASLEPFDLEQGPLVRAHLFRLSADEHVLLVTMHHIVSDGWSMSVLSRELGALYRASHARQPDPLPAPTLQYADYAAWQRRWLEGPVMQRQSAYWRRALADAPGLLTLPTDRPRPVRQDYAGDTIAVTLGKPLSAALKSLGKREGTTPYMTIMAAWACVLARLSGQDEVVIGSPVANRTQAGVESLIGFFVNTLAIRVDLSGQPTVAQLLQRVRKQTVDAQSNQDLPFEQVVELLNPERSLAHSPIFQAMFAWQGIDAIELDLGDVALQSVEPPHRSAMFDLSLDLEEINGEIVGSLEYATALFDRETLQRYTDYLVRVLEDMTADPTLEVGRIALLDAPQRQQLLVDFNATAARYPTHQTVHALFETVVARQPDAIAVSHGDASLSYDALNRRANRVAHALLELGVQPDQRVAICTERGLDTIAGLLGILKAGAAYVPLDPAYPAARIKHMLADSSPVAVLTQRALAASLPATDAPTLLLDDHDAFERWSAHNPSTHVSSSNLVYLIYTSGSTGTPKGVMVEHRNLVNYTTDAVRLFGISPADVVFQQNSLNFDLSAEEIFPALLGGATLMPATQLFGAGSFASTRPSVVHLTAAHWHTLVAEWDRVPQRARELLDSVRLVNVTGDALSTQKLELWDRFRPAHTRLVNTYGPTETTVSCTAAYVSYDQAHARGMSIAPIGTPLANTRIHLLDAHLELVPLGATGEIHIGGDGVARGYLNRDALTAERFIRDPFSSQPGARLYRTGDLARWLPDGSLEYLGRNDSQVKIRGFRIELGEVEARLADCDGVSEAAVVARKEQDGSRHLVAYVVPQDGVPLTAVGLHAELAGGLAGYMIPDAFVLLDALPLTPNGKLDRQALPAPEAATALTLADEAPVGDTELAIAQIWRELLGFEQVGRHDNFFDLGGHSLLAVQLVIRMNEQFGIDVSLDSLFESPTLSQLADTATSLQLVMYATHDLDDLELELGNLSESELLAQLKDTQSE
ncbi:amino acid adenylation domain-containing protein [Paraburkholderia sp. BL8N3]|nr:non-ribosomal peptide synthase/polyketide synthase [Paraburkholderia sp. BL8N3]TCK33795.1 amino acid adenylation domain-containing protein [Paraburkholderia sp. BL8N3]